MKIILKSNTLSRSELEAGLSLCRAFFPEDQVGIEEDALTTGGEKGCKSEIQNDIAGRSGEIGIIGIIQIEINYPDNPWQITGTYSTVLESTLKSMSQPSLGPQSTPEPYRPQAIEPKDTLIPNKLSIRLDESEIQAILAHPYAGKETQRKLLLKRGLLALLAKVTGHNPPWGILTGIRPSKILHRLRDAGYTAATGVESLQDLYSVREDKAKLLQGVVTIQQPFLEQMKTDSTRVAVYMGIPFCPTRCSYCSFPAYSLKQGREPLVKYLQGLGEEIRATGEWMAKTGLVADSIYLGGGTPTILTSSEISRLIDLVMSSIPTINSNTSKSLNSANGSSIVKSLDILNINCNVGTPKVSQVLAGETGLFPESPQEMLELTVEAGRPDTLAQEKLVALRESGVNRLSINPQTMHNRTLQRIGRAHTVEDILEVYQIARQIPGWIINMDLILGLPGEGVEDIQATLEQIKVLAPDNLTVHALAIKRGSKEREQGLIQSLGKELEAMQEIVMIKARSMGMQPYYLYRQKHIAGNLENIGFAKPGRECRYNIGIMEEYQTVIGLGAGASSKIVNPADFSLVNLHHQANWQVYLERWRDTQRKRAEALKHILYNVYR